MRERIFWECVLRSSCLDHIEILDVVFRKDCAHGADQCEPVGMRVTVRTIILDPEDFLADSSKLLNSTRVVSWKISLVIRSHSS